MESLPFASVHHWSSNLSMLTFYSTDLSPSSTGMSKSNEANTKQYFNSKKIEFLCTTVSNDVFCSNGSLMSSVYITGYTITWKNNNRHLRLYMWYEHMNVFVQKLSGNVYMLQRWWRRKNRCGHLAASLQVTAIAYSHFQQCQKLQVVKVIKGPESVFA